MPERRVGLWLIGALGGVGSTIALGLAAMRRGLTDRTGLVTDLPFFPGSTSTTPVNSLSAGTTSAGAIFLKALRCWRAGSGARLDRGRDVQPRP